MDRTAILAKTQKRHEGKSERGEGGCNNPPSLLRERVNTKKVCIMSSMSLQLNPILHGLFQAGSTRWGGGGHKVSAAFFSETIKANAIKAGTLTN